MLLWREEVWKFFLETERLILRQFTEDDADNLLELDSDPESSVLHQMQVSQKITVIQTQILPRFWHSMNNTTVTDTGRRLKNRAKRSLVGSSLDPQYTPASILH